MKHFEAGEFNGLETLARCLRLYVNANKSRFTLREDQKGKCRIVTVVLSRERIPSEDRFLRPIQLR
jgi:hypothetical protein